MDIDTAPISLGNHTTLPGQKQTQIMEALMIGQKGPAIPTCPEHLALLPIATANNKAIALPSSYPYWHWLMRMPIAFVLSSGGDRWKNA